MDTAEFEVKDRESPHQHTEEVIQSYTCEHSLFILTLSNSMNSFFPPQSASFLPPPAPTLAPAPTTAPPSSGPKYMVRPDLMAQCTSLSAEATYSKFQQFFHNFTLWYSIAFPPSAPCTWKAELFARLGEQLKIKIIAEFD